jgi:outer membrane murein-binding lipoprotein Lpp
MDERLIDRQTQALANMMGADSRRIDDLVENVGEIKGDVQAVKGKVDGVASGVDELRSAMAVLVRHDVQMEHNRAATDRLAADVQKLDDRMSAVEVQMPALIEMRGWGVKAILAVLGVVGLALLALVVAKGAS